MFCSMHCSPHPQHGCGSPKLSFLMLILYVADSSASCFLACHSNAWPSMSLSSSEMPDLCIPLLSANVLCLTSKTLGNLDTCQQSFIIYHGLQDVCRLCSSKLGGMPLILLITYMEPLALDKKSSSCCFFPIVFLPVICNAVSGLRGTLVGVRAGGWGTC